MSNPIRDLYRPPHQQLPELNFLRTCAVLFVIFTHVSYQYMSAGGQSNWFSSLPFVKSGWVGVDLFFVLSGFLIGRMLWKELQATGTIHFKEFWLRRAFRIFPLYFFFLFFVIAVLGRGDFPYGKWWSDPIFLTNYLNEGVVMGSWSLCTEEQFYLLAPLSILFGFRLVRSVGGYRKYLVALILLLPVVRAIRWLTLTGGFFVHDPHAFRTFYFPFHYHCDGLLMGLLLANLDVAGPARFKAGFWGSRWIVVIAFMACIALHKTQHEVFNFTGVALFFSALVWVSLTGRYRRFRAFSSSRIFYTLSRLSYGMYLNHSYLIDPAAEFARGICSRFSVSPAWQLIFTASILVAASAAVATVTFVLIEFPFLQWRAARSDARRKAVATGGDKTTQSNIAASTGNPAASLNQCTTSIA